MLLWLPSVNRGIRGCFISLKTELRRFDRNPFVERLVGPSQET